MTDGRDGGEFIEAIAAVAVGILGGIALGAILSALFKRRCPVCGNYIPDEAKSCPHCHIILR